MKERAAPPLGPRITQSVCPKCLIEVRDGVLDGTVNATDMTDRPRVIDAEIVEEAGTVLLRKSCDRHGPFEDTLATDSEFFWKMESLFPGYDFERTEAPVHGVHSVRYGRGSYVQVDLTTHEVQPVLYGCQSTGSCLRALIGSDQVSSRPGGIG